MYIKHGQPKFSRRDMWSLDYTLAPILCAALKKFREEAETKQGVSVAFLDSLEDGQEHYSDEQLGKGHELFLATLDKMIYAFDVSNEPNILDYDFSYHWSEREVDSEGYIQVDITCTNEEAREEYQEDVRQWMQKCEEGRMLFSKHYDSLWL